jgi:hypothetical protein
MRYGLLMSAIRKVLRFASTRGGLTLTCSTSNCPARLIKVVITHDGRRQIGWAYSLRRTPRSGDDHRGSVATTYMSTPEGATRAATDRPVKDSKHSLYRFSGRTYLGDRFSPSSWPIDSQNRWRDRTEFESHPPTSQRG